MRGQGVQHQLEYPWCFRGRRQLSGSWATGSAWDLPLRLVVASPVVSGRRARIKVPRWQVKRLEDEMSILHSTSEKERDRLSAETPSDRLAVSGGFWLARALDPEYCGRQLRWQRALASVEA